MYVLAIQAQTQLYSYYFHSSLLVSLFLKEILMHATQYNNYSEFGVKIEKKVLHGKTKLWSYIFSSACYIASRDFETIG